MRTAVFFLGFAAIIGFVAIIVGRTLAAPPAEVAEDELSRSWPERFANDYPWWRGATHNDIAPSGAHAPLNWGENTNVVWKVSLPGNGHATPTIVGDRIYVPFAIADDLAAEIFSQWLLILDRATGDELGRERLAFGKQADSIHPDNSNATATIACDGERLFIPYVFDETVQVLATDLDGKRLWHKELGPFVSIQGFSTSPLLYKNGVVVCYDMPGEIGGTLAALRRSDGEILWRVARGVSENYGSPQLLVSGGQEQIVINGGKPSRGYDPGTGRELWSVAGPAPTSVGSPAWNDEIIALGGGYPERHMIAIRGDSQGEVAPIWTEGRRQKPPYIPSMVAADGLLYCLCDEGLLECRDITTGEILWSEKFEERFYSSPVIVGNRIYFFGRTGTGWVYRTGRTKEKLAENRLEPGVFATPIFLDEGLYLRTLDALYFIKE